MRQYLYKLFDEVYYLRKKISVNLKYKVRIMNSNQTVKFIIDNKCSIARYGDGEFDLMLQKNEVGYQKADALLAKRLLEVFENPTENLLICIPKPMQTQKGLRHECAQFWKYWCAEKQIDVVCAITRRVPKGYLFGDSFVSRPYSGFKKGNHARTVFMKLKKVWDGRDLLFIEGNGTQLGVGNDLFDNAASIKRILVPSENAFSYYDQIFDRICSVWNGELVILAVGPTATLLASDLSKRNIQALDLGHIDIQYMWYLSGIRFQPVLGKYTNDAINGRGYEDCNEKQYQEQIIESIGVKKSQN